MQSIRQGSQRVGGHVALHDASHQPQGNLPLKGRHQRRTQTDNHNGHQQDFQTPAHSASPQRSPPLRTPSFEPFTTCYVK